MEEKRIFQKAQQNESYQRDFFCLFVFNSLMHPLSLTTYWAFENCCSDKHTSAQRHQEPEDDGGDGGRGDRASMGKDGRSVTRPMNPPIRV